MLYGESYDNNGNGKTNNKRDDIRLRHGNCKA